MRRRCGTCWWRGGRRSGRWCSRSMPLPIRGLPAATSPGREWHHHSCQGSDDGAVVAGWSFQWRPSLCFDGGSWTAPQDQVRAGAGDDATRKAAQQIIAHSARLRAAGERRIPLYVHDAGAPSEAPLTWDLREHLDRVQVLVRLRNDRVYLTGTRRPGCRACGAGPASTAATGSTRKNPATWGDPDQELPEPRAVQAGQRNVPGRTAPRSSPAAAGSPASPGRPVIKCHLIRVTVERLPNGRKVPGPLWLWWAGPGMPDLDLIWRAYLHRFDVEHGYRFAKTALGWDKATLREPDQVNRWTWLILCGLTQLRLARPIAEDHRQRWERRRKPGTLTPGRVRRDFGRLAALAGMLA